MGPQGWPAVLQHDDVVVRPLAGRDAASWREVRQRNGDWLRPWDATVPPGARQRPRTFRSLTRNLTRQAREGLAMPFAIEYAGRFVGQVTVNNIVRGSAQFASIGYWVDQAVAGRGVVPTSVALVIDHALGPAGLHRIEIAVRPENTNSLRVVEKLRLHEVGYAPRFLHIDGAWRDHRIFAVTVEDLDEPMIARVVRAARHE